MMQKTISLLGSTGSIGRQTLEICDAQNFSVCGLVANTNVDLLAQQARKYRPQKVCIATEQYHASLKQLLFGTGIEVLAGISGVCEIAAMEASDIVLNAVVGMIGLTPTLAAIRAGKDVALANKETLVAGGALVTRAARKYGVRLIPVDSEHSAIFQALLSQKTAGVRSFTTGWDTPTLPTAPSTVKKVILTASGGPFYGKTQNELKSVTIAQALAHPNWKMGSKISIDSATLMNKGLELIEAMWLFDLTPAQIEVVIHRQSILHSAVEFVDHSIVAQLGVPDMKLPIQYALTYPERLPCPTPSLSLTEVATLTFEKPDIKTFVCLDCCICAAKLGGLMPAVVCAAGEMATAQFLAGKISFLQIGTLVRASFDAFEHTQTGQAHNFTLDDIINIDQDARNFVLEHTKIIAKSGNRKDMIV